MDGEDEAPRVALVAGATRGGGTALGLTPGWLRSEAVLDHFGVTEATWRDAVDKTPRFAISESPTYVARGLAPSPRTPTWGYIATYGLNEQRGEGVERFR